MGLFKKLMEITHLYLKVYKKNIKTRILNTFCFYINLQKSFKNIYICWIYFSIWSFYETYIQNIFWKQIYF